ncbi:MAG: hypothetical protein ACI93T_000929 [Porticoccaceae bacterium]|jgi:hypothetical protein
MTNKSNSTKRQQEPRAIAGNTESLVVIRKRTFVIYVLAVVVVLCATAEWLGQYGYSQTISRLRRLSEARQEVVTLAMVRHRIAGVPVEHTITVKGQTVSLFWWPSLMKTQEVVLHVEVGSEETVVTRFNIPYTEPPSSRLPESDGRIFVPSPVEKHPLVYSSFGRSMLIGDKAIQAELQLTPEQVDKVKMKHSWFISEILSTAQHRRFSQIALQTRDPRELFRYCLPKLIDLNTDRFDDWNFSDKFLDRGSDNWPHYYSNTRGYNEDQLAKFRNLESRFRAKLNDKEEQQYFEYLGKPFGKTWYVGPTE